MSTNSNYSEWYSDKLTVDDIDGNDSDWYLLVNYRGIPPLRVKCRDKRNAIHKYLRFTADRRTDKIQIFKREENYTKDLEELLMDT